MILHTHIIHTQPLPDLPPQTPLLRILRLPDSRLPPRRPPIPRRKLPNLYLGPLRRPPNLPIRLTIHVARA